MDELMTFLEMGGYALYVWPSFLASALLLGWITRRALRAEAEVLNMLRTRAAARKEVNR